MLSSVNGNKCVIKLCVNELKKPQAEEKVHTDATFKLTDTRRL